MPDFFAKRYNSQALKLVSALIIFVFLVPYSASVYKGLSGIFSMAFGIDFKYCIIGMALLTGVYVVLGGYMAAAANNFVQGIVMLGGIVAVPNSAYNLNVAFPVFNICIGKQKITAFFALVTFHNKQELLLNVPASTVFKEIKGAI